MEKKKYIYIYVPDELVPFEVSVNMFLGCNRFWLRLSMGIQ